MSYLMGPAGFTPSDSDFAFASSWVWPGTGDGPVLEFELLFRGLSGDLRLPESLLSLERTEAALLDVLEPDGLSFSWWEESSRGSSPSAGALGFSSCGALLYTLNVHCGRSTN